MFNMKYLKLFEQHSNNLSIIDEIKKEYFKSHIIDVNPKQLNGYEFKGDKMVFGSSFTYNEVDPYYLMHEMGHFITIKDYNKLLMSHYGLNYTTKVEVFGVEYEQPITWNAIKNELKAVAFQELLAIKYTGIFPLESWVDSFELMEDFINVPPKNSTLNRSEEEYGWYDNKTNKKDIYSEIKSRRLETIHDYYVKWKKDNHKILNIEYFNSEWFNRVKFIENNFK